MSGTRPSDATPPPTCLVVNRLKAAEGVDVHDERISDNPFRSSERA